MLVIYPHIWSGLGKTAMPCPYLASLRPRKCRVLQCFANRGGNRAIPPIPPSTSIPSDSQAIELPVFQTDGLLV
jgi:hypothetical protein